MKEKLYLLFALTKRDYAVQYAGSLLGMFWIVIQSLLFLGLYILIGSIFSIKHFQNSTQEFLLFLSGIVFWIPLQEYILRTSNILTENRNLLKKTTINIYFLLLVPFVQMSLHFLILSIPFYSILAFYKFLDFKLFLFSFISLLGFGIFLFPILVYIACSNVLLKDITPLLRILLQFLFWGLPVFYSSHSEIGKILSWNPLFFSLELFRFLIFSQYSANLNLNSFFIFFVLLIFFQSFANPRILIIVMDQI